MWEVETHHALSVASFGPQLKIRFGGFDKQTRSFVSPQCNELLTSSSSLVLSHCRRPKWAAFGHQVDLDLDLW